MPTSASAQAFRERLGQVRAPGGMQAAACWITGKALRVELFRFFGADLRTGLAQPVVPDPSRSMTAAWQYTVLDSPDDLDALPNGIEARLDRHTGSGARAVIARSGIICALHSGRDVVAQLNVETRSQVHVDSPLPLVLQLAPGTAFVGFVYTHAAFRRTGAAVHLLRRVNQTLAGSGWARAVAHIRTSNVPSLRAFGRAGWRPRGWLVTHRSGRLLWCTGLARAGLEEVSTLTRGAGSAS